MTNKNIGWALGAAALATMLVLMSTEVAALKDWNDIYSTWFVAKIMAHLGNVIMAFVGGKLIPTEPQDQRKDDK